MLPAPPSAVLDTNVVLDCWVFRDAGAAALAVAVETGALRWIACGRMRDELQRTLEAPRLARWSPDADHLMPMFERLAEWHPSPPPAPMALRCGDSDDQVFIDLALAHGTRWLFSHDRALLSLNKPARLRGVHIVKPTEWRSVSRYSAV